MRDETLPTKKKYFWTRKNILRICPKPLLKSLINPSKIINKQKTSNEDSWRNEKKTKTEKEQASTKYLLKYEIQENLMQHYIDYATLCIN